jgi:hypothetical protein
LNNKKVKDIVDSLVKLENVLTIGYIGSLAKVFDLSRCRDVDILVILDGKKNFEREIYNLDGLEFDISYITLLELENQISKRSTIWVKAMDDYKIIYSLNENIKEIITQIKEILSTIDDKCDKISDLQKLNDIKFLRYDISNKLSYLISKKENKFLFNFLKDAFVLDTIKVYFELKNISLPKVKNQMKEIQKNDMALYELLEKYYMDNQIDVEEILYAITDCVLNEYGGRLYEFEKGYYPVDR